MRDAAATRRVSSARFDSALRHPSHSLSLSPHQLGATHATPRRSRSCVTVLPPCSASCRAVRFIPRPPSSGRPAVATESRQCGVGVEHDGVGGSVLRSGDQANFLRGVSTSFVQLQTRFANGYERGCLGCTVRAWGGCQCQHNTTWEGGGRHTHRCFRRAPWRCNHPETR